MLKAEGIVAKDRGGTSDPFCELVLGNSHKKTKVLLSSHLTRDLVHSYS